MQIQAAGLHLLEHDDRREDDFEMEPIMNRVSGRTGAPVAASANPQRWYPRSWRSVTAIAAPAACETREMVLESRADPFERFGEARGVRGAWGRTTRARARRTPRSHCMCTMFSPINVAKSPRIDPGGAWMGFVGPISVRQT